MTGKLQEVDQRNNTFEELAIEADIIKAHGNIITYWKQGKEEIPTNLTDGQINVISNEQDLLIQSKGSCQLTL